MSEKKVEKFLDVIDVNGDVVRTDVDPELILKSILKSMAIEGHTDDESRTKAYEVVAKANVDQQKVDLEVQKQADEKELEILRLQIRDKELEIEDRKSQRELEKAQLESDTSKEVNWVTNGVKVLTTAMSGGFMISGTKAAFGMDQTNVVSGAAMNVVRFFTGKFSDR